MKTLKKGELFRSVKKHLETKGVILEKGEAVDKLKAGCALLTTIATQGQVSYTTAKSLVTSQLNSIKQSIHEKTAPAKPKEPAKKKKA